MDIFSCYAGFNLHISVTLNSYCFSTANLRQMYKLKIENIMIDVLDSFDDNQSAVL